MSLRLADLEAKGPRSQHGRVDTLGWVQPAMVLLYQHVPDGLRRQAAERIDLLLWAQTA